MEQLTSRQAEVLDWVRRYIEIEEMPPTRAEIARGMGFRSANAAEEHLQALARKGALALLPGASRGIRLPAPAGLPVVGQVAAGSPILAEQHIEGYYRVAPHIFKPRADYFLRVRGTSMRDAGILNGDLLAVHRTSEVRSRQIVVARLDDEVTVKRFQRRGKQVQLLAENPDFKPIHVDLRRQQLVIEGLGVGVLRNRKT